MRQPPCRQNAGGYQQDALATFVHYDRLQPRESETSRLAVVRFQLEAYHIRFLFARCDKKQQSNGQLRCANRHYGVPARVVTKTPRTSETPQPT